MFFCFFSFMVESKTKGCFLPLCLVGIFADSLSLLSFFQGASFLFVFKCTTTAVVTRVNRSYVNNFDQQQKDFAKKKCHWENIFLLSFDNKALLLSQTDVNVIFQYLLKLHVITKCFCPAQNILFPVHMKFFESVSARVKINNHTKKIIWWRSTDLEC